MARSKVKKSIDYFSIPETAAITKLDRQSVWRYVKSGQLPAMRVGNRYIVPHEQVMALVKEQRRKSLA